MAQVELIVAAVVGLLVLLTWALRYELGLSTLIAGLLSVSVVSVGFMVTVALHHLAGLSTIDTAIVLGLAIFVMALAYEIAP